MTPLKISCLLFLFLSFNKSQSQTTIMAVNNSLSSNEMDLSCITPLPQAYAHNDYWHRRPLWDALSKGFTAIEVDIHLVRNDLMIAHKKPSFFQRKRYLTKQYLKPLWKLYKSQNGNIYPNYNKPILLIIDIKTDAASTYKPLLAELEPYQEMLTCIENDVLQPRAVTVLISGNRPVEILSQQKDRCLFLDGRINDRGLQFTNTLTPIVSDNWNRFFGHVSANQRIPERDLEILKLMVDLTHSQGKKLRLWNTPESKRIWTQLLEAGVDYINTDQLEELSLFLIQNNN